MEATAAIDKKPKIVPSVDLSSANPRNAEFPEIVTVTQSTRRVEATEEKKLVYQTGAPKGTVLVKRVSVTEKTIRTTTPYTGTV